MLDGPACVSMHSGSLMSLDKRRLQPSLLDRQCYYFLACVCPPVCVRPCTLSRITSAQIKLSPKWVSQPGSDSSPLSWAGVLYCQGNNSPCPVCSDGALDLIWVQVTVNSLLTFCWVLIGCRAVNRPLIGEFVTVEIGIHIIVSKLPLGLFDFCSNIFWRMLQSAEELSIFPEG